jgi:hypothetical protein
MTNKELGSSYSLITAAESFYIRINVGQIGSSGGSAIYLPNLSEWRVTPSQRESSIVKTSVSEILNYSNIGSPLTIAISPQNVQFKITSKNVFRSANNGQTYFPTASELPQYIWLLATPIPSVGQSTGFSAATMYKFSTNEFMDNAIIVTANTSKNLLYDAGYKIN